MTPHLTEIGEVVCINKPSSFHHEKFGEYAGLADVYPGAEQRYRIDMGEGQIYVFTLDELIII